MLAVKDIIDVAGVPTTAGSRAVADGVAPAEVDADCMRGARSHRARLIGKTNLFELAFGASGLNEHFGTPVNPLDRNAVPGGSSSGSAVAVATHEADVAYGSDTGGSIRIPSAFCGTAGLKTTFGRVPLSGVWPLAPSFDTVGPMARDVAGLVLGMELLEPGFVVDVPAAGSVARLRLPGIEVDPLIDSAVGSALALAELEVSDWELPRWLDAHGAAQAIINFEAVRSNRGLTDDPELKAKLGHFVTDAPRARGRHNPTAGRSRAAVPVELPGRSRGAPGPLPAARPALGEVLPAPARGSRCDHVHRTDEPAQPRRVAGAVPASAHVRAPAGGTAARRACWWRSPAAGHGRARRAGARLSRVGAGDR